MEVGRVDGPRDALVWDAFSADKLERAICVYDKETGSLEVTITHGLSSSRRVTPEKVREALEELAERGFTIRDVGAKLNRIRAELDALLA